MGHASGTAALDALVTDVIATRRRIAALQAREARLLALGVHIAVERMSERRALRRSTDHDLPLREIAAELGAAMRLPDRLVQTRMGDATTLVERFPATLAAWDAGEVDAGHVTAIVDAGARIAADDVRAAYETRVLAIARAESPARLRPAAKAIAAALAPPAVAQFSAATDARRVRVVDLDDGMARLIADLPAVLAHAILDRLTRMGRAVKVGHGCGGAGSHAETPEPQRPAQKADELDSVEPRTLDQVRADVLADLMLAGAPAAHGDADALGAIRGHVQVTIPALALAGASDAPGLLSGHGPVDPGTVRRLAGAAPGWDRVFTHPRTGAVLSVDRYRPSADLLRHVKARDEHCRFPGCRQPARRCDVDHTHDAALGGTTSDDNLAHFCRRHHTLKHVTPWSVRQVGGGVLEWRSPTGRTYEDRPAPTVRFVPDDAHSSGLPGDDPPPF